MVTWVLEDGGGVGNDVCLSVTEEVGGLDIAINEMFPRREI
ncbi:hypothetical protein [Bartonella harrusi]|nr:hypothetical protein [Bartonella harrusi]